MVKQSKEKKFKKKNKISKFCYIVSVIFAACAVYFLISAIIYISGYMESYGMTFKDMWSDSVSYVAEAFLPYLAYSVILLGIGKAIRIEQ